MMMMTMIRTKNPSENRLTIATLETDLGLRD
jgi:hypothetical protein